MKTLMILRSAVFFSTLLISIGAFTQNSKKDRKLIEDSRNAKDEFIRTDGLMNNLFSNAYGYVIFPNV
jgi:hypothetical protein